MVGAMSATSHAVRTAHRTGLAVDPATSTLRHAAMEAGGGAAADLVVALRVGADAALLARRDGGPLRLRAADPEAPFLACRLVGGTDPATVAFRHVEGRLLTASPGDGSILVDRTEIAGWELFTLEPDDDGARGDLADLLASDAALTTFCLDPAQAAATVGGLLALLPVERRRGLLAALAGRPDGDLIFAAARRLVSGGQERSAWHARRHLAGGIAAHGWIVGDHSYGTPTVIDGEFGHLEIGRYCAIAGDVRIIVANHAIDRVTTYPFAALHRIWPSAPADGSDHAGDGVVIGHDVWIGQGVTVLPGARIGDGAIVGAAAVIAGTVPPFSVVVGNPARVLRRRFDDETIRRLLAVGWWHWPDDKVDRFVPLLLGGDIGQFLDAAEGG